MEKIFQIADDVHVVARRVYAKSRNAYAYSDAEQTVKIDTDTLQDLFYKGAVIRDGDNEYRPISLIVGATSSALTYVKTDTETPTTAVLATLASEEYVAQDPVTI